MRTALLVVVILLLAPLTALAADSSHPQPLYELPPAIGMSDTTRWAVTAPQQAPSQSTAVQPAPKPAAQAATPVCIRIPVLVVIYTNTAAGTVTAAQITKLKSEAAQTQLFYWRNSHMKCYLDISYCTIDEYKPITDFWEIWPNSYWLGSWIVDPDLRERGYTNGQYASVITFYAWGQNGYGAAVGGGAYGVNSILNTAAYVAIPFCWDPETNDSYFMHEFHHNLDSMWEACGYPSYPHADQPQYCPGDFGESYDFNAFMLRSWPTERWKELRAPWGYQMSVTDVDLDGVPDTGIFPITETSFISNVSLIDTDSDGLTDLGEAMAGFWNSSKPYGIDTDADGINDGLDKYPLYAMDEYTPKGTRTTDGSIESSWHILGSPMAVPNTGFTSTIRTNWDDNYLYLSFRISNYSSVHVYLDVNNDGWFHGKDNYEIIVDPSLSVTGQITKVHIWDCSAGTLSKYGRMIWDDDSAYTDGRIVVETDIKRGCTPNKTTYNIELGIPKNLATGLIPAHGKEIGLRVWYENIGHSGSQKAFAFEQDSAADIVLIDAPSWARATTVSSTKTLADGQWVDIVGKTVTAVFNRCFYIGDDDRTSGIKVVSSTPVSIGDKVRVLGKLGLNKGERELQNTEVSVLTVQ